MQESDKVANAAQVQNEVQKDEFRVGDVVWCLLNGEGQVISTEKNQWRYFNIEVQFKRLDKDETWFYTEDGKINEGQNRTLFFSEPKIEASVTRPFVPTLVGKRVVVLEHACYPQVFVVTWEDESMFGNDEYECIKSNSTVYEVSSENLLTSKK